MNKLKTIILLCITTQACAVIDAPHPQPSTLPQGKIRISNVPEQTLKPNDPLKPYFKRQITENGFKKAGGSLSALYSLSFGLLALYPEYAKDQKINDYQRAGCGLLSAALSFLAYYLLVETVEIPNQGQTELRLKA